MGFNLESDRDRERYGANCHDEILVGETGLTIGRKTTCQLVIAHPTVSRQHATLSCNQQALVLTDQRSRNGTFVNEEWIDESVVAAGDSLRFGAVRFWVFAGPWRLRPLIAEREPSTTSMHPGDSLANKTVLSAGQMRVLDLLLRGDTEREIAQQVTKPIPFLPGKTSQAEIRHDNSAIFGISRS